MRKQIIIGIVALLSLLQMSVFAVLPSIAQVPVTPPKVGDKPVEVDIGVYVEEIIRINEGENSYEVKGYLDLTWRDARLRFDSATGTGVKTFLERGADLMLEKIWWPDMEFVNELKPRERLNEELLISADGHVNYRERFNVQLATNFELKKFPFDSQRLVIHLESFAWNSEDLVLKTKEDLIGFSPEFKTPGWTIEGIEEHVREHKEPRDRALFSELEAVIAIRRDPGFFVWKFLVPLAVVMVLLSGVLWIPPQEIKERIGATLTGILTSAAYGFIIAPYLPSHVYDTYLDKVVAISLLYSSALMIQNIVSYRLYVNNHTPRALKIDQIGQVAFPVVFLVLLLVAKMYY